MRQKVAYKIVITSLESLAYGVYGRVVTKPFSIAFYALLTMPSAHVLDLASGNFVHTLGDAHFYKNHLDQAQLQLSRVPHPAIKGEVSV